MLKRQPLPEKVQRDMNSVRKLGLNIPQSYINFHAALAKETLEQMKSDGIIVHSAKLENDGWFDGMRAMTAVVEVPRDKLFKIQWNDSNQGFMVRCESGGWGMPMKESEPLKPYFSRSR